MARGAQLLHARRDRLGLAIRGGQKDVGPEKAGKQQVALAVGVGVPAADDDGTESEPGGDRRGLARLVRLRPGPVHQHVAALLNRLGQGVLELPDLVPPHGQPGVVLAFHQQPGAQLGAQPRQRFQRSGQDRKVQAGQAPEALADFFRGVGH